MVRWRLQVGPGGLIYAIVAGLILTTALYTQANLLFWALGLMAGGLVTSLALAWAALRGVRVERLLPDHGVAGQAMILTYQLRSARRWLPAFNVVVRETWGRGRAADRPAALGAAPQAWVLHLGPGQTVQAQSPCWPRRRGVLAFERVVVTTAFPFGILRRTMEFACPAQVVVYPHLYRIDRSLWQKLAAADPAGHLHAGAAGGTEEFHGLRRYRPGDSFRLIDWKHSAKAGELICREMTQPAPPRVMLLLDLAAGVGTSVPMSKREEPGARSEERGASSVERGTSNAKPDTAPADPVERAVSLAASLVVGAHFHGYQVGLAVRGAACPSFRVHHSLPHRQRMLEALALLDATRPPDEAQVLPAAPSVVIRPGRGGAAAGGSGRCLILGAAQMEEFVMELAGDAEALLAPAALARRRHRDDAPPHDRAEPKPSRGGTTP